MQLSTIKGIKVNKRIIISVADQAIYSGANYLFNILLFRLLNMEEYGFFAYTYSIFIFFNFIFSAGVLEPLTVNGVKKGHSGKLFYNYYSIIGLIILVLFFFLALMLLQGWLFSNVSGNRFSITLAVSIGMLANFILITFKRIEYNENNQRASLISSVLYCSVLLIGISIVLFFKDQLLHFSMIKKILIIYYWMAIASTTAIFFFGRRLVQYVSLFKKTSFYNIYRVGRVNFGIAGWMLVNCIFFWLTKYFFSAYLGYTKGFQNTGMIKLAENLFLPMEQFVSALGLVVLPAAINIGTTAKASEYIKKVSAPLLLGVASYSIVVIIFFKPISYLLYGTGNFDRAMIYILCSLGLLTVARAISDFYFGLRVRLFRKHKFFIIISSLTFLAIFLPGKFLLNDYGLYGVSIVYFLTGIIQILVSFLLINKLR